ncbi:MAG: tRNA glutamyl-Q(34) synthetase GluQRS [Casimicrobiaceae bacterium]
MSSTTTYRGRFAPSPTGPLHFGSLVAAMASWCDARCHNGEWFVRIEDIDTPRSRPGATDAILSTLAACGFEWDGAVVQQSQRLELYRAAFDDLVTRGLAFSCTCTRRQLEHAALGAGGERIYPGTCRSGIDSGGAAHAWRLRVNDEPMRFVDRLQGAQEQRLQRDVGDFVVRRNDGLFAYQLAVVVDDADQAITHVVRGADLLSSTPRQIWIQRQLGLPTPVYLHHAVARDARGEKLSKQTEAAPLPANPLPALERAWHFLAQQAPPQPSDSVADFWQWAHRAWNPRALPAVAALPEPPSLEAL